MNTAPRSGRQLPALPHLIRLPSLLPFIIAWIVTGIIVPGEAFANNNFHLGGCRTSCSSSSSKMPFVGVDDPECTSTQLKRRPRPTIPWLHRERSCFVAGGDGERFNHRHREGSLRATGGGEQCEDPSTGNFGRRSYWEESYSEAYRSVVTNNSEGGRRSAAETTEGKGDACDQTRTNDEAKKSSGSFAWYCTWEELEPFWRELVPLSRNDGNNAHPPPPPSILIPGVGNDPVLRDMYDAGYTDLSAFDYAPSSVDCCRALLGEERLSCGDVRLDVADARDLSGVYEDGTFDAVLDKGTLDAVYLIGGDDKEVAYEQVRSSICELHRVLRPGGVAVSITGVSGATDAIGEAFASSTGGGRGGWTKVRDTREGVYFTEEDGYASINIDATFLAWTRDPE